MSELLGSELGPQVYLGPARPSADKFRPAVSLQNRCGGAKPDAGGFWTSSPTEAISGWAEWCASESFATGPHECWLLTPEPDAEVAQIDSLDDLTHLHYLYGRSTDLGSGYFRHLLDFGLIAERYAAVHLTEEGQWRTRLSDPYDLYGWDCESTLWLRFAFVKVEFAGTVVVGPEPGRQT